MIESTFTVHEASPTPFFLCLYLAGPRKSPIVATLGVEDSVSDPFVSLPKLSNRRVRQAASEDRSSRYYL